MATATLIQQTPAATVSPVEDALLTFGELYRDDAGVEVWRIRDFEGRTFADGIASDFDAQWVAEQMVHAHQSEDQN